MTVRFVKSLPDQAPRRSRSPWWRVAECLARKPGEWAIVCPRATTPQKARANRTKAIGLVVLRHPRKFEVRVRDRTVYARCVA